ncbi:MAG: hypothetical protein U0271_42900 [Polyangiaceae bacterium]
MNDMKRLVDETDSEFDRALLEAGIADAPPPRSLERTLAAMGLGATAVAVVASTTTAATGVAAGSAGAVSAAGAGKAAGAALLMKWVAGVALAGAVLSGGYVVARSVSEGSQPAVEAPATAAADRLGPNNRAPAPRADADGPAAPTARAEKPVAAEPAATAVDTGAPQVKTARSAAVSAAKASVEPDTTAKHTGKAADLAREMALLNDAERACRRGDKATCNALLDSYQSQYPKGQLASDVARIRALGSATDKR